MEWFPPIDTIDPVSGSHRITKNKINTMLNQLFTNNEGFTGIFPVYKDYIPDFAIRPHSRDRRRVWHGGIDLMYDTTTSIFPIATGKVIVAKDAGALGHPNNRVVIKHRYRDKDIFSHYVHIDQGTIPTRVKDLVGTNTLIDVTPWKDDGTWGSSFFQPLLPM